ncbi:MAG: NmrA family NAD(P)-binding protein [Steroidobacteraceae bacterium]
MGLAVREPGEDAESGAEVPRADAALMLFVSGANGQFAGHVIRNVLAAGRGAELIVGTRNVNSAFARDLGAKGVTVREADFRRPESMRAALQGVSKALFTPTYDTNDVRLQQNLNAIEAARAVGVKHVVYPSFLRAESPRVEHSRLVHLPTENALRASGLGFTILRHALYADILVGDLRDTLATGVFRRPSGSARSAYVAREDLGFSAATVLLRDEPSGQVYNETMERTYSGGEVAALIAEVFDKPVRFEPVPATEWPQYMTEHWGVPPELAKSTIGTMQAVEAGEFDVVTHDYERITGRPARSMRQFMEDLKDAST